MSRQRRQASRYLQEAERLGRLLQEARAEAGLTQIEVAVRSGVPYSTLRAIERARVKEPCFFAVLNICDVIGIKPTRLASVIKSRRAVPNPSSKPQDGRPTAGNGPSSRGD